MTTTHNQNASSAGQATAQLPTFMDHVNELKGRLFWVGLMFIAAASAAYPFYQQIIHAIVAPLGDQKLYYTTPAGGLSLIIKICMFAGLIGMLPMLIYQLYRFVSPVMQRQNTRAVIGYTTASVILAGLGVAFAYFVSLPASLYFLTSIQVDQVNPLLTLDAYLSFISAYIIAGAVLFQLPLIMLIINAITPLTPKKLMSYQRYLIVGAFIIAAVITPTPDAVNQTLLAAPIIVMYQLGIMIVWLKNRKRISARDRPATTVQLKPKVSRTVTFKTTKNPAPKAVSLRRPVVAVSQLAAQQQSQPTGAVRADTHLRTQKHLTPPVSSQKLQPKPIPPPALQLRRPLQKASTSAIKLASTQPVAPSPKPSIGREQQCVGRGLDGFAVAPRYQRPITPVSRTLAPPLRGSTPSMLIDIQRRSIA